MNNVIMYDDSIVGTFEDLWKNFKEELKRQMEDNTISFEELRHNFTDILELMEEMESDKDIYSNTLVKIQENAMGGLNYKKLEEID